MRFKVLAVAGSAVFALLLTWAAPYTSCGGRIKPYAEKIGEARFPSKVVIFGDCRPRLPLEIHRKESARERKLTLRRIADEYPAFIANTGDLVGYGSCRIAWLQFDEEHDPIFSRRIPYYPALGNHEYNGDNDRALANYFDHFPLLEGRKWYVIRHLYALFVFLDSNFGELDGELATQTRWLEETLRGAEENPEIQAVFLLWHHPPYTNSKIHQDSEKAREHFVTRMTPKVKAVITGHAHTYERFVKDGVQYVVSGGGGAPITGVDVESPRHPDEFKGPARRNHNYLRATFHRGLVVFDVLMLQDDDTWKRVDGFQFDLP